MAVNDIYFGLIDEFRGKNPHRIAVIGKQVDHKWIVLSKEAIREEVGETRHVFITSPDYNVFKREGLLISFRAAENQEPVDEGHDEYIMHPRKSQVNKEGAFIVPFSGSKTWDSILDSLNNYLEINQIQTYICLFLKLTTDTGSEIMGPFKYDVDKRAFKEEKTTNVYAWNKVAATVIQYEKSEILLVHPRPEDGTWINLCVEDLGVWLRSKIKKANELGFLTDMDKRHPGWRDKLREQIAANSAPDVRAIDEQRWESIDSILDHFTLDRKQLEELKNIPLFKEILRNAIYEHQENLLAPARESFKVESAMLDENLKTKRSTLEDLDLQLRKREKRLADLTRETASIQERFQASRKQLFQDFIAFRTLIEEPVPLPSPNDAKLLQKVLCSNPIFENTVFVEERLLPIAQNWDARFTLKSAHHFHMALLACRMVLVPNPAWIRAYHEALGVTSLLKVIQVKPTWLGFEDAWAAGIDEFWSSAVLNPDRVFFLYLQDIDRALMEMWARPLLDLNAGFQDMLPTAPLAWPVNLRVVMTRAKDEAVLPISDYVLAHLAAPNFSSNQENTTCQPIPGHVPVDIWLAWSTPTDSTFVTKIDNFPVELKRMLQKDLSRLQAVVVRCGYEGAVPERIAQSIRLSWHAG